MTDDSEFITKLINFGLSEKEAQLYFHLLKYGPKTPSLLAKSLKTYREDVHRTLNLLIDKGMVNPSLDSPTVYSPVELDIALDAALKRHETELRMMDQRKQELQELSKQQLFRPSDEFSTFKILKRSGDVLSMILSTVASTEREWVAVMPAITLSYHPYVVAEEDIKFIDRGGRIRFIADITYPYVEAFQQHLNAGIDIRHFDKYAGLLFFVFDRKIGMSAISADVKRVSLDEPVNVLWTDDPVYAEYLISTFELLWKRATPASQRIEELLKAGPPDI